jgi:hypothetical protein
VGLEEETAIHRLEGTMEGPRGSARVSPRGEGLPPFPLLVIAHNQFSGEEIDLLPILVNKRRCCENTRLET